MEPEQYPNAGDANPVARVGVVGVGDAATKWMDTGSDDQVYLARVAWLPESREVAIERLPRSQKKLDLLIADAASGKSRVILSEQDPHWINVADDLKFLDQGDRFIWSSERSGFRHLYLYGRDGKNDLATYARELGGHRTARRGRSQGLCLLRQQPTDPDRAAAPSCFALRR